MVFCCFTIGTVLTVWHFVVFLLDFETVLYFVVFHRCWNYSDSVVFFCFSIGTVLRVRYFVVFHRCWNCPECVILCCFS